jgi:hypothetical protein
MLRFILLLAALSSAPALAADRFDALHEDGLKAYADKDYARLEQLMREAEPLRPQHPRTLYNLAAALALQGRGEQALPLLQQLAELGFSYPAGTDADFASLADNPAFQAVIKRFETNLERVGRGAFVFSGGVPRFIADGLAYDRFARTFYMTSARERRILLVTPELERLSLVNTASNGLWSALGIYLEQGNNRLWVASSALPMMEGYEPEQAGRAGIFVYDSRNGNLRNRYLMPEDGVPHELTDLVVSPRGAVYVVDRAEGRLYTLDRKSGNYQALTEPGALHTPQGLSLSEDSRTLYIADSARGLFRYDLRAKSLSPLPLPATVSPYGLDGIYVYKDSLVAVRNGFLPYQVLQFRLNGKGDAVNQTRVLLSSHPDFEHPGGGLISGRHFYFIANSQWNRIGKDNRVPPNTEMRRPVVLRVDVSDDWKD